MSISNGSYSARLSISGNHGHSSLRLNLAVPHTKISREKVSERRQRSSHSIFIFQDFKVKHYSTPQTLTARKPTISSRPSIHSFPQSLVTWNNQSAAASSSHSPGTCHNLPRECHNSALLHHPVTHLNLNGPQTPSGLLQSLSVSASCTKSFSNAWTLYPQPSDCSGKTRVLGRGSILGAMLVVLLHCIQLRVMNFRGRGMGRLDGLRRAGTLWKKAYPGHL